jgi:hypothetical protein
MPDAELLAAAESGTLSTTLPEQVQRMLDDDKSHEFAANFGGQWLNVRHMEDFEPPSRLVFPEYDDALRDAAKHETLAFFESLYAEGLPLTELLTADYTIANARLGEHYGIAVSGDGFQRTSLESTPRRGFLTQASFLISSSHPGSTSPPRRGKMVLERFMCSSIQPPPPGVEVDLPTPEPGTTRREQLALHRADPECNVCHQLMDPIGFGFENFDAIGTYRTEENGGAIDSSGLLPTQAGEVPFSSPVELATLLSEDPRYASCVTEKLLTYAVGRTFADDEAKAYATALAQQGMAEEKANWRSWLEHVVLSEAFLTRRGEAQ